MLKIFLILFSLFIFQDYYSQNYKIKSKWDKIAIRIDKISNKMDSAIGNINKISTKNCSDSSKTKYSGLLTIDGCYSRVENTTIDSIIEIYYFNKSDLMKVSLINKNKLAYYYFQANYCFKTIHSKMNKHSVKSILEKSLDYIFWTKKHCANGYAE